MMELGDDEDFEDDDFGAFEEAPKSTADEDF